LTGGFDAADVAAGGWEGALGLREVGGAEDEVEVEEEGGRFEDGAERPFELEERVLEETEVEEEEEALEVEAKKEVMAWFAGKGVGSMTSGGGGRGGGEKGGGGRKRRW